MNRSLPLLRRALSSVCVATRRQLTRTGEHRHTIKSIPTRSNGRIGSTRWYTISTGSGRDDEDTLADAPLLHVAKTELERLQKEKYEGILTLESLQAQIQAIQSLVPLQHRTKLDSLINVNTVKFLEAFDVQKDLMQAEDNNNDNTVRLEPFHVLLNAMAESADTKDAGERAEILLDHLESLHHNNTLDPPMTTTTYNCVLLVCARARDPKRAQEILNRLILEYQDKDKNKANLQPNLQSFSYTISAWSDSDHPQATERIQQLQTQMKEFLKGRNKKS